jgi:hypothetical protein
MNDPAKSGSSVNSPSTTPSGREQDSSSPVVRFDGNATIRWNCEAGDLVAWISGALLMVSGNQFRVSDIWETREGDSITISDRPEDFPAWFQLAADEVSGPAANAMVAKLNRGEIVANEPVRAANVWRLTAGSRLAWMGVRRPAYPTFDGAQGLLQLVDFHENALAVGESPSMGADASLNFGALATRTPSPEVGEMPGSARKWVRHLGMPRVMAVDWAIG